MFAISRAGTFYYTEQKQHIANDTLMCDFYFDVISLYLCNQNHATRIAG